MTEKIGLIKNPLTIIAIFAGIAEVSGTIVLPFVAVQNQQLFIWFLILFPSILVIAFFTTLNFNNKVLYAPSDYKDEGNYLLSNKYSVITQSEITVKEPVNIALETMSDRIDDIYSQISTINKTKHVTSVISNDINIDDAKEMYTYRIISEIRKVDLFIKRMSELHYTFTKYESRYEFVSRSPAIENRAIWLGVDIPLEIVKEILNEVRKFYPFLTFIHINEQGTAPGEMTSEIFIGGSTKAAVSDLGLRPIGLDGFERINQSNSLSELHEIVRSYYKIQNL
jgi:hypothetical protein